MDLEVLRTTELPEPKRFCSADKISKPSVINGNQNGKSLNQLEQNIRLELKKQKKLLNSLPKFRLREHGEIACLTVEDEVRIPLFMMDIQHLIMYSQMGAASIYSPARWCQIERLIKLQCTNVLLVENMSLYDYVSNESKFPYLSKNFKFKMEMLSSKFSGNDCVQELLFVPLSNGQIRKYVATYGDLESAASKDSDVIDSMHNIFPVKQMSEKSIDREVSSTVDNFPRTSLLLSGWQMVEENFPLPIKGMWHRKYKGYVLTKDKYEEVGPNSPMFGLDCEMCKTSTGELELTRITIVDETYNSVYEELVKPDNKIVDYLTRFSGITEKLMSKATKNLRDVQQDLRKLLPADAIIVGQQLSSDFHALKIMHPYVIDTSVIFNLSGKRARKSKLKDLTSYFLNEKIQASKFGHCSREDSTACLKLVKLKLTKTLYFGDAVMSNSQTHHHPEVGHSQYGISMLKHITKENKNALVVALTDRAKKYQYYTFKTEEIKKSHKPIVIVAKETNDAVMNYFHSNKKHYNLRVAHCRLSADDKDVALAAKDGVEEENKCGDNNISSKIDGWVRKIEEQSEHHPSFTVVVFTGGNDTNSGCCFINIKV